MDSTPDTLTAAHAWHAAGCSVIRAAADGSKAPLGAWKQWQQEQPTEDQLHAWFAAGHPGIGIVCGQVSGHLEMLELEGRAMAEGLAQQLADLVRATGLADTWTRLMAGCVEQSPSGGLHILYRVADGPARPNTKLARRPATAAELATEPADKIKVLVETRGEGGFTITWPSHGPVHPTGRPWTLLAGGPATIPAITAEQRDALHAAARTLDRTPPAATPVGPIHQPRGTTPADNGGLKPGDDYNNRTTWTDILTPLGWTAVHQRGDETLWRRPGKHLGVSASTGYQGSQNLYVWSTSTDFQAETPYTRFGAYALLHHGGDHSAAASTLRTQGYGTPPTPPRLVTPTPPPPGRTGRQMLGDTIDAVREYLHIDDDGHLRFALAVAVSAALDDEPLWGMIVGNPSGGKTEAIRIIGGVADECLDELTGPALLSWTKGRNPKPTGVLTRIGSRGLVTIGDFSTVLATSDRGGRDQLFSLLRRTYDGSVQRDVGNAPEALRWQGRLTMLAAVTPTIDHYHSHTDALGPRWLYCRLPDTDDDQKKAATRKRRRVSNLAEKQETARKLAAQVIVEARRKLATVELSDDLLDEIEDAAMVTCLGRAAVPRHAYGKREIDGMPSVEEPPRLVRQLTALAVSLVAMGCTESEALALARRCALDTIPRARFLVLDQLALGEELTVSELWRLTGVHRHVVRRVLEDLEAVGVTHSPRDEAEATGDWDGSTRPSPWGFDEGGMLTAKVVNAHRRAAQTIDYKTLNLARNVGSVYPSLQERDARGGSPLTHNQHPVPSSRTAQATDGAA